MLYERHARSNVARCTLHMRVASSVCAHVRYNAFESIIASANEIASANVIASANEIVRISVHHVRFCFSCG